jgi:hypothetical protein
VAYYEVLSRILPGGTKGSREDLSNDKRSPARNFNRKSLSYEAAEIINGDMRCVDSVQAGQCC